MILPRPALMSVFVRELVGSPTLPREPEPSIMDEVEQVAVYTDATRSDGMMAASQLFHTARICQVIKGCRNVLDLGCGPGTQLVRVAELNPDISFQGVDLSERMLAQAEEFSRSQGVDNVDFLRDDITTLRQVPDDSVDGVMSSLTLHHLPTQEHLRSCFAHVRRVLRSGGALYLVDFGRLKSLRSVLYFAYMNRKFREHLLLLDYERSLRAAFRVDEIRAIAEGELPGKVTVHQTFKVPFLVVIKSEDRMLPPELRERFQEMRRALPFRYRCILDELRFFFRLGGLDNDPFGKLSFRS